MSKPKGSRDLHARCGTRRGPGGRPLHAELPQSRPGAGGIYSDWVHLTIDSYHDRRTGFRFSVNPRRVEKDVDTFNDANEDLNWDAVWQVGTRIDSLGWVAEYRIPLSQLRFGAALAGAAKVTGKAGPWTVGMLDAVTTRVTAPVDLTSGARGTVAVEPLTNYFAARVKHDFRQGASSAA